MQTVIDYLIKRLEKLEITDVFGLPGDFNFNIIEAIEKNPNTNWIGCTNELNAGYGVRPIVIVINNSGYTIERALCKDPMDVFNNIASWNYSKLTTVFNGKSWTKKVETEQELQEALKEALKEAQIEQKDKLCYIEICTDKMDMPKLAEKLFNKTLVKV